jgi:hypothetical protein
MVTGMTLWVSITSCSNPVASTTFFDGHFGEHVEAISLGIERERKMTESIRSAKNTTKKAAKKAAARRGWIGAIVKTSDKA